MSEEDEPVKVAKAKSAVPMRGLRPSRNAYPRSFPSPTEAYWYAPGSWLLNSAPWGRACGLSNPFLYSFLRHMEHSF